MASGYQNIDNQHQAAPVYTPAPNSTPYTDQESLYSGPTSYGSPSSSDSTPERPAWMSVGGAVIIYDCFVLFLSFIAAFITLVKLGGNAAKLRSTGSLGSTDPVLPVNASFIVGFISFLNLFLPAVLILIEIHFPMVIQRVPQLSSNLVKAVFYLFFAFINFGFAGNFGLAVGALMLFAAVFNGVAWFLNRNN